MTLAYKMLVADIVMTLICREIFVIHTFYLHCFLHKMMIHNCIQRCIVIVIFLIPYQKSSCIYPFVNIWSCREKSKATKRIFKSDLMCFAKQRKSSNCIVDIVQMNFFAAIDTHPWSNKDYSNSFLSSRLYSPICLYGNPYQNRSRWVRTQIALGIWSGSEQSPERVLITGYFK